MSGVVVGGQQYPCEASIATHPRATFSLADAGCRQRTKRIRKITLHWTGGEPVGPWQTADVLRRRRLGVEFIGPFRDGTIYQCCDPSMVDAKDDGLLDSVGIEIPNYGFVWPNWTRWGWRRPPRRGRDREVYSAMFRGKTRYFADFRGGQRRAIMQWLDTMTAALGVPRDVPREPDGRVAHATMSRDELANFDGVLGHYHISRRKSDPGPRLICDVASHFFATSIK